MWFRNIFHKTFKPETKPIESAANSPMDCNKLERSDLTIYVESQAAIKALASTSKIAKD